MMKSSDPFWAPVSEAEEKIKSEAKAKVDQLQRAINLAQRISSLKNAPGFQQFEAAIEDLRKHAQDQMVTCTGDHEQLRILQGRCQAYSSIMALMRRTETSIENLSQQLVAVESQVARSVRPDGKVVPEPQVGAL